MRYRKVVGQQKLNDSRSQYFNLFNRIVQGRKTCSSIQRHGIIGKKSVLPLEKIMRLSRNYIGKVEKRSFMYRTEKYEPPTKYMDKVMLTLGPAQTMNRFRNVTVNAPVQAHVFWKLLATMTAFRITLQCTEWGQKYMLQMTDVNILICWHA